MKPGIKSTEFWVLVGVNLLVFGALFYDIDAVTPGVVMAVLGIDGAYVGGRSYVKGRNGRGA